MTQAGAVRIRIQTLRELKQAGRKFAMLTAYDYPTAVAAQAAGVHSLLVGDSLGTVLLGHENTRRVPLELMLVLAEAVRRGAPRVFLIGDMPYEAMAAGDEAAFRAARRFCEEAGCDAVKIETEPHHEALVSNLAAAGICVVAHLGLRPQSVLSPEGYRAQARDEASIAALVDEARRMVRAGAQMVLLEAVPPQAAEAVLAAVSVPLVGCGAGPACDGHVVVTYDMLGIGLTRPPRFVPVLAQLGTEMQSAMRRYVEAIEQGSYPGPEHVYAMRRASAGAATPG